MSSIPPISNTTLTLAEQCSHDQNLQQVLQSILNNPSAQKVLDIDGLLKISTLDRKWHHQVKVEPKPSIWPQILDRIPIIEADDHVDQDLSDGDDLASQSLSDIGDLLGMNLSDADGLASQNLSDKGEDIPNPELKTVQERLQLLQKEFSNRFLGFGLMPSTSFSYLSTEKILELFRARDTLIVWEILADQISSSVLKDAYENLEISTYADIIRFTNQFDLWVDENLSALNEIEDLNLAHKGLTSLPPSIGKMTLIESLNLQGNHLTSLPSSIGDLAKLRHLNVMENDLISLPDEIGNCGSLKFLECSLNPLSSLPDSFSQLTKLEDVYFYANQFTSLPSVLGSCVSLNRLEFGDIRTKAPAEIPDSWSNLTNLELISLTNCKFTSVPDFILELEDLCSLNLNFNRITHIPDQLARFEYLDELELDENPLEYIPEGLRRFWPEDYQAPESSAPSLKRARHT